MLERDIRKVTAILKSKKHPKMIEVEYEGNEDGEKFHWRAERRLNDFGYPLVAAQEIYNNPRNFITERRTFEVLNTLVKQGKAGTHTLRGIICYSWIGGDER